jgi:hypothetical protein
MTREGAPKRDPCARRPHVTETRENVLRIMNRRNKRKRFENHNEKVGKLQANQTETERFFSSSVANPDP